jgi:hypothetical protein
MLPDVGDTTSEFNVPTLVRLEDVIPLPNALEVRTSTPPTLYDPVTLVFPALTFPVTLRFPVTVVSPVTPSPWVTVRPLRAEVPLDWLRLPLRAVEPWFVKLLTVRFDRVPTLVMLG